MIIDYLCNAVGFFTQLLPCGIMVFLCFHQDSLRFSKKAILIAVTAIVGALALLFPLLLEVLPNTGMAGDIIMLVTAIAMLMGAFVIIQEPAIKKLLVFFVVLFYAVVQFWMVNATLILQPTKVGFNLSSDVPYGYFTTILYVVYAVVTLPLMWKFVLLPLTDFLQEMEPAEMRREFTVAILTTSIFIIAMMYAYNIDLALEYYPAVLGLELLLMLEQFLLYWLLFRESLRRKRDEQQRRALQIQKIQFEKISREMENARRLRHDLRHHMNTIGALNAQGKRDEITAYLKQYGSEVTYLDDLKFSGDPMVDGVLEYYLSQARDMDVTVDYAVSLEGDTGVEPTDMTVLLGNCLENALEALKKLPENRRTLSVDLRTAHSMILLRIRNAANLKDSGDPSSWTTFVPQEPSDGHGVGLSSVNAIAKKYHGSALFQSKDGEFTTRIILNPKLAQE